jgi:hypothetical protein
MSENSFKKTLGSLYRNEKTLFYLIAILFINFIILEFNRSGDFRVFVEAAKELLAKGDIYSHAYDTNPLKKDSMLYYYYSPLFALIISLFAYLPHPVVYILWKLFNIILLIRIWKIFKEMLDLDSLSEKALQTLTFFSFLFVAFFLYINFHNQQMTIFLLYLTVEGLYSMQLRQRNLAGAFLISIAVNIKLLSLVVLPYLIYRRNIKGVILVLLFTLIFLFLPAVFIGWDYNLELIKSWWSLLSKYSNLKFIDKDVHSLSALIPILLSEAEDYNFAINIKRNFLALDPDYAYLIANLFSAGLILFTLYFLRTLPFTKPKNRLHMFWELSYILAITPLIFPQQRRYAFFFVFPAITYLVFYYFKIRKDPHYKSQSKNLIIWAIPIFILFNLELILGHFRHYYWFFKTVTYGGLLLLIPLAIYKPFDFKDSKDENSSKHLE